MSITDGVLDATWWGVTPDFNPTTGDGTDNSDAIADAISYGHFANPYMGGGFQLLLPAGNIKISRKIRLAGTGVSLTGRGNGATKIWYECPTGDAVEIVDGSNNITVKDLSIDSTCVRTSGAGIHSPGIVDCVNITNVNVANQFDGLELATCGYGLLTNVKAERNYRTGVYLHNSPTNGGLQWQMNGVLSQLNDGNGFAVQAIPGTAPIPGITVGTWNKIDVFGNSGYGVCVIGLPECPIYGLRTGLMFSGQNGRESIYLDSFGSYHRLSGVYVELDGSQVTGRNFATPATHTAHGIVFSPNNLNINLSDVFVQAASCVGIINRSSMPTATLTMDNVKIEDSGAFARNVGFFNNTNVGRVIATNFVSGNTGAGATQTYGFYADNLGLCALTGYDLSRNNIAPYGGGDPAAFRLGVGFP